MEPPKPAGGGAVGNGLRMQQLAKQKRRDGMAARKGAPGPKQDENLRRNPGIGQSTSGAAAPTGSWCRREAAK